MKGLLEMSEDVRLDLLRDAIAKSKLDGQTKDVLADDLQYAQAINGTQDAALQGIKRLVISGVRRELLAHDRTTKAVEEHEQTCGRRFAALAVPAAAVNTPMTMAMSAGLRVLAALLPFRWPLAMMIAVICVFSPSAMPIVDRVLQAFGR